MTVCFLCGRDPLEHDGDCRTDPLLEDYCRKCGTWTPDGAVCGDCRTLDRGEGCACGRDLAWIQRRIAAISRALLTSRDHSDDQKGAA